MKTQQFRLPEWFSSDLVAGMKRGIEKEGLRMRPDGYAARTPHPADLGSKLTHPYITTDYSENLLELITEPFSSIKEALDMLRELHVLVHRSLGDELMWPLSMPCMTADNDEDIPLADYGTSNIGKLKTCTALGLGFVMVAKCRPSQGCTTTYPSAMTCLTDGLSIQAIRISPPSKMTNILL